MTILTITEVPHENDTMVFVPDKNETEERFKDRCKQAFEADVLADNIEGNVDSNNTFWDDAGEYGEIAYKNGARYYYDITYTSELVVD